MPLGWSLDEAKFGGFTDHRIRDAEDFRSHRDYIHQNPAKRGLVVEPHEYRYCSAFPGFKLDERTSAAEAGSTRAV